MIIRSRAAALARARRERGASALEYAAVIVIAGALLALIVGTGAFQTIGDSVQRAVCGLFQGPDACAEQDTAAPDGAPVSGDPDEGANEGPVDDDRPLPDPTTRPPDDPGPVDQGQVDDTRRFIREYLDFEPGFWPWEWDGPDSLELYQRLMNLTGPELDAALAGLSEDELRELFASPVGINLVAEHIRRNASLDTLRRLGAANAFPLDPRFDNVGSDTADTARYGEVPGGQLFGGPNNDQISIEDINQQALSDCWWMASLGATAQHEPGRIRDMIVENPNGTFTVTFPDGEAVTVTPDLPLSENGNPVFAGTRGNPPVLWPAIMEKALAQRDGGYEQVEVDSFTRGMEILTGNESDSRDSGDVSLSELAEMHRNGDAIAFNTPSMDDAEGPRYDGQPDPPDLNNFHFYVVTGVNEQTGEVTLYNPWGRNHRTVNHSELDEAFVQMQSNNFG
ncbi:C2 family cysteine protease [Allonocardiopsis opalescens]|uniref:Calpain family cysteine protease n=1 Tax=Allonocardiopsis opalescens TaxID=1144618 RepID=A0A2T0Q9Z4_9ACTN|nr:C2 family cysteine protease [Allonocardiopsis opalescens]PRY00630.1 calpain family cysteine protease [Allonocardiopsis opalescens]